MFSWKMLVNTRVTVVMILKLATFTSSSKPKPVSFKEVIFGPQWKATMTDEFNALISNETWELVPPTDVHNLVVSKLVL